MASNVDLWVCSRCHVLQGIEVWSDGRELKSRCVNCGVPLQIDDVKFINQDYARAVINEVERQVPQEFHDYVRYSWVSNKTVGIIFEITVDELMPLVEYDPLSYFEDKLGPELGITVTVFFE